MITYNKYKYYISLPLNVDESNMDGILKFKYTSDNIWNVSGYFGKFKPLFPLVDEYFTLSKDYHYSKDKELEVANEVLNDLKNVIFNRYGISLNLTFILLETVTENVEDDIILPPKQIVELDKSLVDGIYDFNVENGDVFYEKLSKQAFKITMLSDNEEDNRSDEELDEEYVERNFDSTEEDPIIVKQVEEVEFESIQEVVKLDNPIVFKDTKDDEILKIMVKQIEGGYYHPAMKKKFPQKFKLYGKSGEMLWGIDRAAGGSGDPKNYNGIGSKFWKVVDKHSGYGEYWTASNVTLSENWDNKSWPYKENAWEHNRHPYNNEEKDLLNKYLTMFQIYVMNNYFNGSKHPVRDLIENDGRFKFLYLRACWNGIGHFRNFYKNIRNVYDKGEHDVEKLISLDLKYRKSLGNKLINIDVDHIENIIGIKAS